MLITCKVVGDSILYILSCARNTLTMIIKSYEIIMFEIYKYRIIFILTSTSYLLFSFPSNMDICSKKVVVFSFFFFFFLHCDKTPMRYTALLYILKNRPIFIGLEPPRDQSIDCYIHWLARACRCILVTKIRFIGFPL